MQLEFEQKFHFGTSSIHKDICLGTRNLVARPAMANKILFCWLGATDLKAAADHDEVGLGPVAQAVLDREYSEVVLLNNWQESAAERYVAWLQERTSSRIAISQISLTGPTNFGEIYQAAIATISKSIQTVGPDVDLVFHLSPGTPAMAAVWILLAKTRFPAELIESSKEHGVRTASVPFDISADFLPDLLRERDKRLLKISTAEPPSAPEFSSIIHRSRVMTRLIKRARQVAVHNVPVLMEGESGTGKEMLARAIHRASLRKDKPFITVNCGAIPDELLESELFGHEKGAFTGASHARKGYFEAADGGTLFLDEIGELPLPAQVKLLRVLQEGAIIRLGSTRPFSLDVRIIAATNRILTDEIVVGRFREDLFYRLAVAVLKIPALRERTEDLGLLVDTLFNQISQETSTHAGARRKKISAKARNLMLAYGWPGNVRELLNTLYRAIIWSESETITAEDMREAMLPMGPARRMEILERPLGGGLSLPGLLEEVARHYLVRAMDEAAGNKTKAAELVGLPSYQTFTNWLSKYRLS